MADNSRDEKLRFVYEVEGKNGLDAVTEALARTGEQGGAAGEKLNAAAEDLGALLDRMRDVEALQSLEDRLAAVDDKLSAARDGLEKLNESFSATDKSSAAVSAQFDAANKAVSDLAEQHDRLAVRVSTAQAALAAAGVNTKNLGAAHDDLSKKAQESATKLVDVAGAANRFGISFAAVRETVAKAGESLKSAGGAALEFGKHLLEISGIAGVVTSALAAISGFRFFETGVEEARSGEVALAKLKAAVDGNAASFDKLKGAAEKAAEEVGTTGNDSVETLTRLTAALGDADAAAQALPATLTLGKAAQIDFGEAADLVATTLKSFGLAAGDAGEVADKLAAIAAKTGVNLAELARGAAQVAPLAKEAGVGFDGVASALAELSSKGFDAQKSNAALREMFTALSQPTSKLRQDLVGLGIDTSSLGSVLDGLRNAGDRGTQALQDLSTKGRAGISALVQGGSAELQQFQQLLDQSGGAASNTAKLLGDTFDGAVKSIGRTIDSLAEDTVKDALPAVSEEIRKLNDELKDVGKSDTFVKIKESVKDFVAAAVKAFDEFVHAVDWKSLGETIAGWAASVRSSLSGVAEGAAATARALGSIGDVVGAVYQVVRGVVEVISMTLGAALSGLAEFIARVVGALGTVIPALRGVADEAHLVAQGLWEGAKKDFWSAGDAASKFASNMADLAKKVSNAGDAAKDAAPKHDAHAESIEQTGESAKAASPEIEKIGQSSEKTANSVQLSAERMKTLRASMDEAVTALGVLQRAGITAGPAVEALANQIQGASAQISQFGRGADSAVPNIDAMIAHSQSLNISLKDLQAAAQKSGFAMQNDLATAATESAQRFADFYARLDGSAAKLADARNAFLDYAKKQLDATKDLDEGEKAQAQSMLETKAAALGLTNTLQQLIDSTGKSGIAAKESAGDFLNTARDMQEGMRLQQQQMAENAKQSDDYATSMGKVRDTGASLKDRMSALGDAMKSASNDTEKAAVAAEGADLRMQGAGDGAAYLTKAMEGARNEFVHVSEAATAAFDQSLQGALRMQGIMPEVSAATDKTANSMEKLREAAQGDIIGFDKWLYALAQAQQSVQEKLDSQRATLAEHVKLYDTLGTSAQQNFGIAARGSDALLASLSAQKSALEQGNSGYDLLGAQELTPLRSALDAAIQRTQQLADAAAAAKKQFDDMAASVNDALLQEQGNQAALEDERHQKQLDDLKAAATAASALDSDTYQKAVRQENDLHSLKMKNIAEQDAAAKKSSAGTSSSSATASGSSSSSVSPAPAPAPGSGVITQRVEITINGNGVGQLDPNDPRAQAAFMQMIMTALAAAKRNSGF